MFCSRSTSMSVRPRALFHSSGIAISIFRLISMPHYTRVQVYFYRLLLSARVGHFFFRDVFAVVFAMCLLLLAIRSGIDSRINSHIHSNVCTDGNKCHILLTGVLVFDLQFGSNSIWRFTLCCSWSLVFIVAVAVVVIMHTYVVSLGVYH